jgi:hypothetical protein
MTFTTERHDHDSPLPDFGPRAAAANPPNGLTINCVAELEATDTERHQKAPCEFRRQILGATSFHDMRQSFDNSARFLRSADQ